jgi:hypothetical protein
MKISSNPRDYEIRIWHSAEKGDECLFLFFAKASFQFLFIPCSQLPTQRSTN